MENEFKSKEAVLHLLKQFIEFNISKRDFDSSKIEVRESFGNYVATISRQFYGEQRQDEIPVSFVSKRPATWWEHFKESNFSKWLLKKYPVKYKTETHEKIVYLDRTWVFPDAYIEGHPHLQRFYFKDNHSIYP